MIVKVCGMRESDNIRAVENAGADWIGFIFTRRSPRFVEQIPSYLPSRAQRIGVFVDADTKDIVRTAQSFGLDYLQLHGSESAEQCRMLHSQGFRLIKVFSPNDQTSFKETEAYETSCEYFLFDTPCITHGGSGLQFDWKLLLHYNGNIPFLLSGGLGPDSLQQLAEFNHPQWAGIDLNSRFETAPAVKDTTLLKNFIQKFKTLQHNESHTKIIQ